jgi:hypothetical protein
MENPSGCNPSGAGGFVTLENCDHKSIFFSGVFKRSNDLGLAREEMKSPAAAGLFKKQSVDVELGGRLSLHNIGEEPNDVRVGCACLAGLKDDSVATFTKDNEPLVSIGLCRNCRRSTSATRLWLIEVYS